MKRVRAIAYRFLTAADYFNMYKQPGTEQSGGGQLYVDFPTAAISIPKWKSFFRGITGCRGATVTHGRQWDCPVLSIGIDAHARSSRMILYQRRRQTVCIANQNMHVRFGQRIPAWHPDNGFPKPRGAVKRGTVPRGLCVFLVCTYEKEVWAGWFRLGSHDLCETSGARRVLHEMLDVDNAVGTAGLLKLGSQQVFLREEEKEGMFTTIGGATTPEPTLDEWFDEDDESQESADARVGRYYQRVRARNRRAVADLKELYGYSCQVTGGKFVFESISGHDYVEAHHLIPLGKGGADNPHNIIIVSGHIHRMCHHAKVVLGTLDEIETDRNGWGQLPIRINEQPYEIRWHPRHLAVVQAHQAE